MTAVEIVRRFRNKPLTRVQVDKLKACCDRMGVPLLEVCSLLTDRELSCVHGIPLKGEDTVKFDA